MKPLSVPLFAALALTTHSHAIDWPAFMAENDLVWEDGISPDYYNGAFIGDGMQGAMIMRDELDEKAVRMLLGHYNAITHSTIQKWEYCNSRAFAGNIMIVPTGDEVKHTMRLDLWNATARGTITTNSGAIDWEAINERKHRVFVVKTKASGDEKQVVPTIREEWGISPRFYAENKDPQTYPDYLTPKPEKRLDGSIRIVVQKLRTKGAHAVASQLVPGEDGEATLFVAIGTSHDDDTTVAADQATADAVGRVKAAVAEGAEAIETRHRQWWNDHLSQRYLDLPEDPEWRKFWWRQVYKFASASAEDTGLIIDTQGPWVWKSGWAAVWWNLNAQLSYYPMFAANQLDVGKSLIDGLDRIYKNGSLRANAGSSPGIYLGRSGTQNGLAGWGDEYGNLPWALHNYWRYWQHTGDDEAGKRLFPMLADSATFLISKLEEGPDGKLHIKPSRSPEYTEELHRNANYALMSADWNLRTLLDMNQQFGFNDPRAKEWQDTLDRMVPFPTDENGYRVNADEGFDKGHRHYSHLVAIYPYHSVNPDQGPEQRELIERSLNRWFHFDEGHAGYTYTGGSVMYATLGQGDKALETLDRLKPMIMPNTMYKEGGGQVIETPLSGTESITYMLLQSWGGVLRPFPAMPSRWKNATFHNLTAEGAFVVSAEWKDGKPAKLSIKSIKGNPCTLTSPWQTKTLTVTASDGRKAAISADAKGRFTFPTQVGVTYQIAPGS
jgi:alpha-L-fucosidase 2